MNENDSTIEEILADPEGYMDRARERARPAAEAEVTRRIAALTERRQRDRAAQIAAMPAWYRWIVRWWEEPRWTGR